MFRVKISIAAALVSILTLSCTEKSDDKVNREILWSTVWRGERFQPSAGQEEEADRLYVFGADGMVKIYPESEGVAGEPVLSLRYIYTSQAAEMVIEDYGLFSVKEITVDRLLLEGSPGTLDLRFYSDTAAPYLPPKP